MEKIKAALQQLDGSNANHWTADGAPRLETVKMFAGDPSITRDLLERVAPGFSLKTREGYQFPELVEPASPATPPAGVVIEGAEAKQLPEGADAAGGAVDGQGGETGQAEQPEVEATAPVAADEISSLEKELEELSALETEARADVESATLKLQDIVARRDALTVRLDNQKAKVVRSTNDVQKYLERQRQELDNRAQRMVMIRESGIDLKLLASNLQSPIDAARARKR